MTTTVNGTTGITYPDASTLAWTQADLDYFYWGQIDTTPTLQGVTISGSDGVVVADNTDFNGVAPERIRAEYGSLNGTTTFDVDVPAGTTPNDTVLVAIMFENSNVARPTISGFTEVASRNGTFTGSAITHMLFSGNITDGQTTITIPNDATFNGGCAIVLTLYGEQTVSATTVDLADGVGTTAVSNIAADSSLRQMTVWLGLMDSGTEVSTSWPTPTNADEGIAFINTDTVIGRAGIAAAAYETNTNASVTLQNAVIGVAVGTQFWRVECTRVRS